MQKTFSSMSLLLLLSAPFQVQAGDPVIAGQKKLDLESEKIWRLYFSGLIDLRFVYTGKERSWAVPSAATGGNSAGGRGLSRYGGVDRNEDGRGESRSAAFKLPQAYLVTNISYGDRLSGKIQLQFDDADEGDERVGNLGITEAFAAYENRWEAFGLQARGGFLIPPVSLEHPNVAWSTEYTVTPSALNTWIGEEIRPTGLELQLATEGGLGELSLLAAPFSENDAAGTLLAFRGWAMHDLLLRRGLRMRLENHPVGPPSRSSNALVEVDGRLGVYAQLAWKTKAPLELRLFGYDNNGNEETANVHGDHAWNTDFLVASVKWEPVENLTILGQGLKGKTSVRPGTAASIHSPFYAYYLLASYLWGKERFSARYDQFRVIDKVWAADEENQRGHALTAAYFHKFSAAHTAGIEWLHIRSQRPGNANYGTGDPEDDLFQLAYRFTF